MNILGAAAWLVVGASALASVAGCQESLEQRNVGAVDATADPVPGYINQPIADTVSSQPTHAPAASVSAPPAPNATTSPSTKPAAVQEPTAAATPGRTVVLLKDANSEEGPEVVFDPPVLDFGEIPTGTKKTLSFTMTNRTHEPVHVVKVIGRNAIIHQGFTLEPGDSIELPVTLHSGSRQGVTRKHVLIVVTAKHGSIRYQMPSVVPELVRVSIPVLDEETLGSADFRTYPKTAQPLGRELRIASHDDAIDG